MSFQLRPTQSREAQYPNAQDPNMLGYDRNSDRWKVDASGIHLYASGISVDLDHASDSVEVWQNSEPWIVDNVGPLEKILVKKRFIYNDLGEVEEIRIAETATPSGSPCLIRTLSYNAAVDVDYIIESLGVW